MGFNSGFKGLMLFRKIITANYENQNKYIVGAECSTLSVKPGGT